MAVITPDAEKAAVLADGGMTYFSIPIEKRENTEDINPADGTPDIVLSGKATDGTLDSDLQVVDPEASERWIRKWYDTKANVRQAHDPHKPVGRGLEIDGHSIKVRIGDPVAKHLIRIGALNDFSIGILRPDIRKGDPRFRHLDPAGKAVHGVITDRPDGTTELGEISIVDRGANYGAAFHVVKTAADGTAEWTGKMTGPEDVLAKAFAEVTAKTFSGDPGVVTVDLPSDMRLRVSPAQLAKLQTLRRKLAVEEAAKQAAAASPATGVLAKAAEPDQRAADPDEALKAAGAAEDAILGKKAREFSAEQRREHASTGVALADGSYPMPDADAVRRAAILIRSKHGDWKAAAKLLGRRVKALGIPNPLKGGKKDGAAKAAKPAAVACDICKGTGKDGDTMCKCDAGARLAARTATRAAKTARKEIRKALAAPGTVKKKKVMCPGCGARQSRKHSMCSECGGHLAGAMPVTKNHDFTCLGCGKELDKGEPHCPGCGKENPGYLPEADHKVPANEDKAAKPGKGKKPKGGKKDEPFGGRQAKPFGGDKDDDKDDDGGSAGKASRVAKAGKRKTPADGVPGGKTKPVPAHREPDGAEVEAFEADAGLSDGDHEKPTPIEARTLKAQADPEIAAALRCKSLGVPLPLGMAHDLTCPAYHPADVAAAWPAATFKSLDLSDWQARATEAAYTLPIEEARKGLELWNAALLLKTADPFDLADIRDGVHKAFRDLNPGPGHFPVPGVISPERFRRPYITDGRAAPSPGQEGPNTAKLPPMGGLTASDYQRGFIQDGHAADSPSNEHHAGPMPAPGRTGEVTSGPARTYYRNTAREGAQHAMRVLHDHISATFPDLCPVSGTEEIADRPVPTPAGVAAVTPAPGGKKKAKAAKARARKIMTRKRRALKRKVFKGTLSLDDARVKLGLDPFGLGDPPGTAAGAAPEPPPAPPFDAEAMKAAVAEAQAPLLAKMARQDKAMRKQAKMLDHIAGQPDTSAAPFRGVAAMRTPAAPAGPLSVTKSAQDAQNATYARMFDTWRNSEDPVQREAAWAQLRPYWDPNMHLPTPPT